MWNILIRALVSCLIHFLGQPPGHQFQCKYNSSEKNECQSLFVQKKNVLLICIMIFCSYRENIGLLALTRIGSRRVVQISAGFMIFFSVLGNSFYYAVFCCVHVYFPGAVIGWWYLFCQTRKIWSSVCVDSTAHICWHVLSLIRICW